MDVQFNEERHEYSVNGKILKSVTQIMEALGITWFPENAKRDYYLLRGGYVHEAIRLINHGVLDDESVDDAIKGYVEAYHKFVKEVSFRPEMIEYRSANLASGYAGTLDCVGELAGTRVLVDFKSGGVNEKSVRLQTAAYMLMDGISGISARYGLSLKADGTYRLSKAYTEHSKDKNNWLAAVVAYSLQTVRIKEGKVVQA